MTEMKENNIYPTFPTAPDIEPHNIGNDEGHSYRLKIVLDVQKFLEEEINKRNAFSKKYFRVAKIINITDNALIGLTVLT